MTVSGHRNSHFNLSENSAPAASVSVNLLSSLNVLESCPQHTVVLNYQLFPVYRCNAYVYDVVSQVHRLLYHYSLLA